jgi:hypothetical protein
MVDDEPTIAEFRLAFEASTGYPPPPGPFPLFRADILDLSIVQSAGDRLDIQWWREGEGVGHVERR